MPLRRGLSSSLLAALLVVAVAACSSGGSGGASSATTFGVSTATTSGVSVATTSGVSVATTAAEATTSIVPKRPATDPLCVTAKKIFDLDKTYSASFAEAITVATGSTDPNAF